MLPGAGCFFRRRKDEVVDKEGQVLFRSGKDEGREWKVRVMGERKWTWRSWTVREEKDAITDGERRGEVNITFGARSKGTSFGRRGLAGDGCWEGKENGEAVRGEMVGGWGFCLTESVGLHGSGGDGCTLVPDFWDFQETWFQHRVHQACLWVARGS